MSSAPPEPLSFTRIVAEPEVFEFGRYNLFKVYQARFSLDRRRDSAGWNAAARGGPSRPPAMRLRALVSGLGRLCRLALRRGGRPRTIFYGAGGRVSVIDGVTHDLYNSRIVDEVGRERCVIVEDTDDRAVVGADKRFRPDLYLRDLGPAIRGLSAAYRLLLRPRLRRYARRVAAAYPQLGWDALAVSSIAASFCANTLVLRGLLAVLRPDRALMICHYGREPFIAACKQARIPVTELMHGAIVGDTTFYRYPESYAPLFGRSLFPDKLAVYGEYWRRMVVDGHMFPPERVVVGGYYLKVPERGRRTGDEGRSDSRSAVRDRRMHILVATQPTVQADMAAYLAHLKAELDRDAWRITVKPHPAEDASAYRALVEPGFLEVSGRSAYELLAESDVHISAYSSVLYEAVFYGVANYALYVPRYEAPWRDVVASGVARPLLPDRLPLQDAGEGEAGCDASFYLAGFDPAAIL